jgi:hypothetical protein
MDRTSPVSNHALEQKFFNSRVSNDLRVRAVTGFTFRQNQKFGFLQNLVNRIGLPH